MAKLLTGLARSFEVFAFFFGMPGEIRLRVAFHERHVERPPGHAEEREPDQFLFDKEFQERNATVEDGLQCDNVDPRLVIGDDQVPLVTTQALQAANVPRRIVDETKENGIVLVEQINIETDQGSNLNRAIVDASVSRVRPVCMAAITTMLGMIPLVFDAFFQSMAVTIIFGLGFATLLTLVVLPVIYALLYRVSYR